MYSFALYCLLLARAFSSSFLPVSMDQDLIRSLNFEMLERKASRDLTDTEFGYALEQMNFKSAKLEKKAIIIVGGPGSGKSYFRDNSNKYLKNLDYQFQLEKYLKVDSEFLRQAHKDFNAYIRAVRKDYDAKTWHLKSTKDKVKSLSGWKAKAKKKLYKEISSNVNLIFSKDNNGLGDSLSMLHQKGYQKVWLVGILVPWPLAQKRGFERMRPYRGTFESFQANNELVSSISNLQELKKNLTAISNLDVKQIESVLGRRTVFTNIDEPRLIYDSAKAVNASF